MKECLEISTIKEADGSETAEQMVEAIYNDFLKVAEELKLYHLFRRLAAVRFFNRRDFKALFHRSHRRTLHGQQTFSQIVNVLSGFCIKLFKFFMQCKKVFAFHIPMIITKRRTIEYVGKIENNGESTSRKLDCTLRKAT